MIAIGAQRHTCYGNILRLRLKPYSYPGLLVIHRLPSFAASAVQLTPKLPDWVFRFMVTSSGFKA